MYEGLSGDKIISNFSGIALKTMPRPSNTPLEPDIWLRAMYKTANPPNINKTT